MASLTFSLCLPPTPNVPPTLPETATGHLWLCTFFVICTTGGMSHLGHYKEVRYIFLKTSQHSQR